MNDEYITIRFHATQWNDLLYWMERYSNSGCLPDALKESWDDLTVLTISDNKETNE